MRAINWIVCALLVIGGLNWGFIGLFGVNFVNLLIGAWPVAERLVYILVGLAAVWHIICHLRCCHKDDKGCCSGH